jgi:hypothetical protein
VIDFPAVMAHVHGAIATIAPHDSQERFEGLGVTVVREHAAFTDPRTLESESVRVRARRVVLATGSRPTAPPIDGLDRTPFHTHETIFGLQALPEHLLVLGGGPIGFELGQAFARLGSRVTIVEATEPLNREDREAVELITASLAADGVECRTGAGVVSVQPTERAWRSTCSAGSGWRARTCWWPPAARPMSRSWGWGSRASPTTGAGSPSTGRCAPPTAPSTPPATSPVARRSPTPQAPRRRFSSASCCSPSASTSRSWSSRA